MESRVNSSCVCVSVYVCCLLTIILNNNVLLLFYIVSITIQLEKKISCLFWLPILPKVFVSSLLALSLVKLEVTFGAEESLPR